MANQTKRTKYWDKMVDLLEKYFPKEKCKERGQAMLMIVEIELFLQKEKFTAEYKKLKDGTYFGEISGLRGVWANGKTLKKCKKELQEVLIEWFKL